MDRIPLISVVEDSELSLVMNDILELTAGTSIGLVLDSSGDDVPTLAYFEGSVPTAMVDQPGTALSYARESASWANGKPLWILDRSAIGSVALLIPMPPVCGHKRVAIIITFGEIDEAARAAAQHAYERRHAISLAYFRLWQVERLRRRRSESLEAALDLTQLGVILIDQSGDITFSNEAAEQIFSAHDGLRRVGNALRTTEISEGVRLQVALNHVMAVHQDRHDPIVREAATVLAVQRKSGPPLILSLLAPHVGSVEPTDVAAIAFVVDPRRDTAAMLEPVCRLYQLSTVETQLVCHLAQGRTISEAAEMMRIKDQTARSYMKQIFIKTNTNRQTELVVLMLSSVVRMKSSLAQKAISGADLFASRSLVRAGKGFGAYV